MISLDECLKQGLIRKIAPSEVQAKEQLKKAETLSIEAKKSVESEAPNAALMTAYAAMLNAARALLFRDGYREKSHACVVKYLEAKYSKQLGDAIIIFDEYRQQRHKTVYEGEYYPTLAEAGKAQKFAEEFVKKIKKICNT